MASLLPIVPAGWIDFLRIRERSSRDNPTIVAGDSSSYIFYRIGRSVLQRTKDHKRIALLGALFSSHVRSEMLNTSGMQLAAKLSTYDLN